MSSSINFYRIIHMLKIKYMLKYFAGSGPKLSYFYMIVPIKGRE